jgi:plastocyanin
MTDTPPDDPTPEAPDADAAATVDAGERTDVESAATTAVAEPAPAAVDERPRDALQTRLLIPLLLPVLAVIAVGIYALNVSRVFLAGDSTSALVIATIITLLILIGGAIISATPGLRTSSLAMFMGLVVVIVIGAGLLALGPSVNTGSGAASTQQAQCTSPTSTVTIEALASIRYSQSDYPATAGCVQFEFTGATGHTMQFRKLDVKGFPIGSVGGGTPTKGAVDLKAGSYEVYCTIDGHAQQGMTATITVG